MSAITLTTRIARPASEVTAWLARPGADARLTPPWFHATDTAQTPAPVPAIYATAINSLDHCHCTLAEEIRAGDADSADATPAALERLLAYRHETIRADTEHTAAYGVVRRLRIAITGASGMIGRALIPFLRTQNHEVIPLPRNPVTSAYDTEQIYQTLHDHPVDVIVNLAGANIAAAKWNQPQRDLIWESRAGTTRALVAAFARLKHRPFVLLNASAASYYGTRGGELLDETAPRGAGFLADVCHGWEHEATAAVELGMRVTCLRFGIVLSPAGSALATMLPYFEKKLGYTLGHGRQWISWVGIDDTIAAIYHAILTHTSDGPVNVAAPNSVTNAQFVETLASVLGKKNNRSLPRWLVRLRFGTDFANETLLASTRIDPARLRATGYAFRHPTLETALEHLL